MLFEKIKIIDENYDVKDNMYILIDDEKIKYIGEKEPLNYYGEKIDGRKKLLMAGFYNTHCHVPMVLLRGYGEGLPLDDWLFKKIFPFEAKLEAKDCYYATLLGSMELLKSGCVSFSDMYFFIDEIAKATEDIGIKINICHGLSSFDENENLEDLKGYRDTLNLLNYAKKTNGRLKVDAGLHAEYTSTEKLVRQIAEFANSENLIVHTHISETKKENEECMKRRGGRTPVKYLYDCGLLKNKVQAAHCVWLNDEDIQILKNADATVIHCISSNLKLGSGIAPIKKYKNQGLQVAIGTDGASSNNNLDMIEELHLSSMVAKGISLDPLCMSDKDTLKMATEVGAKAQGRKNCGVLKEGNKADLIMFDLDNINLMPDYDTIANIVYAANSSNICMTMVDGKILYKNGEFLTIDSEKVIFEVNKSQKRILSML